MPWSRASSKSVPTPNVLVVTPRPAEVVREADQLVVVGDADVREAVGEQQDPVHAIGREAAGDLLAAREPAAVEVRAAAGVDGLQALGRELRLSAGRDDAVRRRPRPRCRRRRPRTGPDPRAGGWPRATACCGEAELVLAAHRARPVEHEAEVDGRPASGRVRATVGATRSTSRKRSLRPLARMRRRSGRTASCGSRSRGLVGGVVVGGHGVPLGFRARRRTGPGRSGPAARRACWSAGPAAGGRGSRCRG